MSAGPVLILGGGSDIGLAIARRFARAGHPIVLAARRPEELEADRSDIAVRYEVPVTLQRFDALALDEVRAFLDGLSEVPEVVVCAVGLLGDQDTAARDPAHAALLLNTNFLGPAVALEAVAERLSGAEGPRLIIGIGSVAGDRGRAANYWYGAAKAAFATMLSGLRQKYAGTNLSVVTLKPGYVATRMTEGMATPGPLTATPEQVAERAYTCAKSRGGVVYAGRIWWLVMTVIRLLPERLFMKLRF